MDRQEFLRLLGTTGVAVCAGCALESCSSSDDPGPSGPTGIDFTIDLSDPANAALLNDDGFVYKSNIIIVCLNASAQTFTAVSQRCTHQGTTINWQASQDRFRCPAHGSIFSSAGTVINGPASISLRQYNTLLTGTELRVFS